MADTRKEGVCSCEEGEVSRISEGDTSFAISSSACFCPEDDDPVSFDGRMITWTFAATKDVRVGAGIYKLEFVRVLTPEERSNTNAQLAALAALSQGETP
jgi:hypothetical protein